MAQRKTSAQPKTKATAAASSERPAIAGRMIEAQKRVIDFQKSLFERGYDMVASAQERQEETMTSWLQRTERIPTQAVELADTWIGARRNNRETYRSSVQRSFELAHNFVDGLAN